MTRHEVHDVEIDIDQHVAIGQIAHFVGVDQFVIKRVAHSAGSVWFALRAKNSDIRAAMSFGISSAM